VDGVEERHDRVILTRHGRPAAVILSPDDLESLEETLDILSDPTALQEIRKAETAIDDGDAITADELRAKYRRK
ncbi:MAG: type II toxin-antitoxin system Phd/YefM family antitoxin, partial [Acidimicrobiales bacterium]